VSDQSNNWTPEKRRLTLFGVTGMLLGTVAGAVAWYALEHPAWVALGWALGSAIGLLFGKLTSGK